MTETDDHESDGVANRNRTVELHVRTLAPNGMFDRQEAVIERLERLESRGVIDEFSLRVWGSRVVTTSAAACTDEGRVVQRRLEEFDAWAEWTGRSLDAAFREETVRSTLTGEEYVARSLPAIALAEFEGDELVFVSPCADDESVVTIDDRLGVLDEPPLEGPVTSTGRPERVDTGGATSETL